MAIDFDVEFSELPTEFRYPREFPLDILAFVAASLVVGMVLSIARSLSESIDSPSLLFFAAIALTIGSFRVGPEGYGCQ